VEAVNVKTVLTYAVSLSNHWAAGQMGGRLLCHKNGYFGQKSQGMGTNDPLQLNVCFQVSNLLVGIIVSGGEWRKSFTSLA